MVSTHLSDPFKSISIVCHDAGAANQILAMIHNQKFLRVSGYVEGPAKILWEKFLPDTPLSLSLPELISKSKILLSGTSWASDLEHKARKQAKTKSIHSIVLLDHWSGYEERFTRKNEIVLPNEIWVVDEYAHKLAKKLFSHIKIKLLPDYYADQQSKEISSLPEINESEVLYLLEPMRSNWGRDEAGEFQALRYFFENLPKLALPENIVIRLRPHPSDPLGKYNEFIPSYGNRRVILDDGDIIKSLSRARWVVGCQTYAMTLALKVFRTVFCSLPPWAPPCTLPHEGLIHIKNLVAGK